MTDLPQQTLRLADLATRRATPFVLTPDAAACKAIAAALDLTALRKLRFEGQIAPLDSADWELTATLGATVVQPCVVTLDPVTTRIEDTVLRRYRADYVTPNEAEAEMPEDDTDEPLPTTLDIAAVMIEALSLALPAFPRSAGADMGQISVTEPGQTPMTDDDAKPFAGLGALRDALANKDDQDPSQ